MLDILQLRKIEFINHIIPIVIIIGINVITQSWWLLENNNLFFSWSSLIKDWDFELLTHITNLGLLLYTEYAYPFIILSMLLLVAMVGAIVLTLELGQITRRQNLSDQHHRNNSWT